ncbi:MAG TPA: serine hydrolase domain-containing protein, partial [Ferruginibacter sp.]|nr:serine hydrolase domain-containing protein [Ferruginibacter sp.]
MKKLFFLLLIPVSLSAQDDQAKQLAQFMHGQHDYFRFNGNVLVVSNGKILYQDALGYADYNSKRQLDNNSVFELASLSKQFTAMAILICRDKKLLNLNDPVKLYLSSFPYDDITIRNLLMHTSGLPAYEDQFEKNWDRKKIAHNEDIIGILAKQKDTLFFKPGTKWKYSNTGYAILAAIIEKVSGMTYNE